MVKIITIKALEKIQSLRYALKSKEEIDYKKEFKKIALVLTSPLGIGDLIMLTPFIISLRKSFPKAKIHLITDKDIFDKLKEIDKIHIVKGSKIELASKFKALKTENYDLGIVMARAVNQSFYLDLLSPRFKLGYLGGFKIIANFKLKKEGLKFEKYEHYSYMGLKIARALGIKEYTELIKPRYSKGVQERPLTTYKGLNLDKKKRIIGIAPYVLWETRRWDERNYIKLIKSLKNQFNFILIGGADALQLNNRIEEKLKKENINITNLTDKFKPKESIFFMTKLDLFLSSDCGPMHFALMMRTPTLALFGPINPLHRLPLDYKKQKKVDYLWYMDYRGGKEYDYESEHIEKEMNGLKAIPLKDVENKILDYFKYKKFRYEK